MKAIWTIGWKEFKGFFAAPSFYVVGGLFTAFLSFTYIQLLNQFSRKSVFYQMRGQAEGLNFHNEVTLGHISTINLILIFLIPILSARLFTEEKKLRTFDLLLTSPVTATQIVVGKFLAALAAVWFLIGISILYPVTATFFADLQWGIFWASYLGLFLLAGIYVSVGLFASSLTDSMILSIFTSAILTLVLWFVAWAGAGVEEPTMTAIINHLSVSNHFGAFVRGSIQVSSLVFSISVMAIYCFLTQRVVESARWR